MNPPSTALEWHGEWNDDLRCHLKAIGLPDSDKVVLYLAGDNCCDMNGAIALARSILPRVARIETFAGDEPDTFYVRSNRGKWKALCPQAPIAPRSPKIA